MYIFIVRPTDTRHCVVVVDIFSVIYVITLVKVFFKIAAVGTDSVRTAVICQCEVFAAFFAARLCTGIALGGIVEALSAVDTEMFVIVVVVFTQTLTAFARCRTAVFTACHRRVYAQIAHIRRIIKENSAFDTKTVLPLTAFHANTTVITACLLGIFFSAVYAQSAIRAGCQNVFVVSASAALIARITALFTMTVFHKLARFVHFIAGRCVNAHFSRCVGYKICVYAGRALNTDFVRVAHADAQRSAPLNSDIGIASGRIYAAHRSQRCFCGVYNRDINIRRAVYYESLVRIKQYSVHALVFLCRMFQLYIKCAAVL